ncbi:MAG: ribonuclease P protein component [Bacteroidetes bacterium]|nr:ribonuclease P protein component [Bacteroidota bacterium]
MSARNTLGVGQRMKREQEIEALFRSGKALSVFPLKLIWRSLPLEDQLFNIQAGFSAPKRRFKKATDRNRIKRLMREQFRLHRELLANSLPANLRIQIFFLYIGAELPDSNEMKETMAKALLALHSKQKLNRDA